MNWEEKRMDHTATPLLRSFQMRLEQREAKDCRRSLKTLSDDSVDLSSNDFLSLSSSEVFRTRYLAGLAKSSSVYPLGSGGSRLLDGNSVYIEDLERYIASFHNASSGLLFNSGYDANTAVFSCVPQPGDLIIYDELIHASVHDGMRLSRAKKRLAFPHNSVQGFQGVLEKAMADDPSIASGQCNVFIAVESLYSMDGDFAPIREILDLNDALLPHGNGYMMVDEAHSTGVFGPRGAGVVQELGVEDRVFVRLHTFGKALASHGAIVLCAPLTREYLINYARSLIYTTAMALPSLVSIRTAYELLQEGLTEELQSQLQRIIRYLRARFNAINSTRNPLITIHHHPHSPIFSVQTPFPRDLASCIQKEGLVVRAIMPPTVPKGKERVRVCLHARNTIEELDKLVSLIEKWTKQKAEVNLSRL